ncbi:hypothetical protein JCM11641_002984 [Rhodosporidiobolus odoratus]
MHSPVSTLVTLVALATCAFASATQAHHGGLVNSRRSGPLAKQRLQKRASSYLASAPLAKRTGLPMLEDLDDAAQDNEVAKRGLLSGVPVASSLNTLPGGSTLNLVSLDAILGSLNLGATQMTEHEKNIKTMAAKARKYKKTRMSSAFQDSVYRELKAYRGSAQSLPGLKELDAALRPLAGDQGLDNFNRDDPIQVAIRTINESAQNTLESINLIVFNLPVLGATLGPILYDIKCILEDLLNITQLQVDGLLNELTPELQGLTRNYRGSICRMTPSLYDWC